MSRRKPRPWSYYRCQVCGKPQEYKDTVMIDGYVMCTACGRKRAKRG